MECPGSASRFGDTSSDLGHQTISEVEKQKTSAEKLEGNESEVEQGKPKGAIEITDLTFECLEKVFNFVPLKDQLNCTDVWPEWRGNVLLSHKQLKITKKYPVKGFDDLSEKMVFGVNGFGFLEILKDMYKLEVLDVGGVSNKYQQQIVEDIGREKRKLRVIKLEMCDRADYGVFKSMVDAVPQLEEFKGGFGESRSTNDNVNYLLTTAEHLHSIDLSGSSRLISDGFRGVRARLKALTVFFKKLSSENLINYILKSSRDTLEVLCLDEIPYSCLNTVSKFKNLKVLSRVRGPRKCPQPIDGPTEVFNLCNLQHLQEIYIRGCFHDEDIKGISGSWKDMGELVLRHNKHTSHQPSCDALMCVRGMPSLWRIILWHVTNLNNNHMEVFSRELVNLKVLWLHGTPVTGEGLKHLGNLPNIEEIWCEKGVAEVLANDEEKEEVLRVLNVPQRERGREFEIEELSFRTLHVKVKTLGRTCETSSNSSLDSTSS